MDKADELFNQRYYKRPKQPSLFNFKPTETLRNSGLTPQEERELIIAAITGEFPRKHRVERTGTEYVFSNPKGVKRLLKNLNYSNKIDRESLAA